MSKRFFTNPGSPFKEVRSVKIEEDGRKTVYVSGKENLQEYIDSFKDYTNIHNILARFAAGDVNALHVSAEQYGDFTGMPTTLAGMLQKVIDGEKLFNSLPVETRQKFDNDFNQFLAQSNSEEFIEKIGLSKKTDSQSVIDKVTDKVDSLVDKFVEKVGDNT